MTSEIVEKYFRIDKLPHIWCPGCGNGIITRAIVRAIDKMKLNKDKVCVVSGIGCSSRASGYLDFNTLHTTHGRAIVFATGIKLANPNLHVIVISGDGDASAIGGNHLIHASRRNIDLTYIVFKNNTYGMTGGQYSPTTPTNDKASTAPYGNMDNNFDLCELSKAAGASYVARGTVYSVNSLENLIAKAIDNKGFSLVETLTTCPTYYGRRNKKGDSVAMMNSLKDNTINKVAYEKLPDEKRMNKIIVGELHNESKPEFVDKYMNLIEKVKLEGQYE